MHHHPAETSKSRRGYEIMIIIIIMLTSPCLEILIFTMLSLPLFSLSFDHFADDNMIKFKIAYLRQNIFILNTYAFKGRLVLVCNLFRLPRDCCQIEMKFNPRATHAYFSFIQMLRTVLKPSGWRAITRPGHEWIMTDFAIPWDKNIVKGKQVKIHRWQHLAGQIGKM